MTEQEDQDGSRTVAPFISTLYTIAVDPACHHVLHFEPDGSLFLGTESNIGTDLLPVYYKTAKVSSFLRNLNKYGFVRTLTFPNGSKIYKHQYFTADGNHLHLIHQKSAKQIRHAGYAAAGLPVPVTRHQRKYENGVGAGNDSDEDDNDNGNDHDDDDEDDPDNEDGGVFDEEGSGASEMNEDDEEGPDEPPLKRKSSSGGGVPLTALHGSVPKSSSTPARRPKKGSDKKRVQYGYVDEAGRDSKRPPSPTEQAVFQPWEHTLECKRVRTKQDRLALKDSDAIDVYAQLVVAHPRTEMLSPGHNEFTQARAVELYEQALRAAFTSRNAKVTAAQPKPGEPAGLTPDAHTVFGKEMIPGIILTSDICGSRLPLTKARHDKMMGGFHAYLKARAAQGKTTLGDPPGTVEPPSASLAEVRMRMMQPNANGDANASANAGAPHGMGEEDEVKQAQAQEEEEPQQPQEVQQEPHASQAQAMQIDKDNGIDQDTDQNPPAPATQGQPQGQEEPQTEPQAAEPQAAEAQAQGDAAGAGPPRVPALVLKPPRTST